MDQSPPKRVTRARAAAKSTDTLGIKTARIATAASKAKVTVTRAASTTKRKTRSEDVDGEEEQKQQQQQQQSQPQPDEIIEPAPKFTRGRPKRNTQPAPGQESEPEIAMNDAPVRPSRGRPKKNADVDTPAPEPARASRGRPKKIDLPVENSIAAVEEPPKRPTRARATTVSKVVGPKKSVKFEEPDKENIVPVNLNAKGKKAVPATGLRAKPVRKPAAGTTARTTRGRAKVSAEEKSSPLSPKKATQVGSSRDAVSEDELATTEKTPMKLLMKSPVKAPGSVFGTAKKLDLSSTSSSITASRATTQDLKGFIAASPARRPPQSPFKDSFKTSTQKSTTMGNSMLQSPFKLSLPALKPTQDNTSFKASLLQSPARRPQSPTKVAENGSPTRSTSNNTLLAGTPKVSTFKISRFATPRTIDKKIVRTALMGPPTLPVSTGSPGVSNEDSEDKMMVPEPRMNFSGRLSSITPREVDPELVTSEPTAEETASAETEDITSVVEAEQDVVSVPVGGIDTVVVEDSVDHSTSLAASPPRNSTGFCGAFALRDESPFDDSDSEDELASGSANYSPIPIAAFNSPLDFASSPATPSPFKAMAKTPKTAASQRSAYKDKIGFTPLARQLSDWMAASPEKSDSEQCVDKDDTPGPSPSRSKFFEDEMAIRDELSADPEVANEEPDILAENFEPVQLDEEDFALAHEADEMSLFEPDEVDPHEQEEMFGYSDVDELQGELAFADATLTVVNPMEAGDPAAFQEYANAVNEDEHDAFQPSASEFEHDESTMTQEPDVASVHNESTTVQVPILDPTEPEAPQPQGSIVKVDEQNVQPIAEPAPSEASQEYGDENATPIDPQLPALTAPDSPAPRAFSTPKPRRVLGERDCHTVFKVPLKAAAEDSPMRASPVKRSASISRLPSQRPAGTQSRSNTVISYSPTKKTPGTQSKQQSEDVVTQKGLATPSKSAAWSSIGTPARTPRRDIDTSLLKGAVVFVDVHTSEGADASALFTELLTQMGARCVKTWSWNGNAEDMSKIGITHVVFKDGGKRTLEKVRETNGVVSCVGVGWVLDCERENKWLDESVYSVDTQNVPRGGGRRRKSMEPRALAKMNGELLSAATPGRNMSPTKEFLHFPETPVTSKSRRRESVQWVRSPVSSLTGEVDDQTLILSPVPATPAPETISAYGKDGFYGEDTPVGQSPYYLQQADLMQRTAPAGRRYVDTEQDEEGSKASMGAGLLSEKKDESVMMRLMAARRKSLQWAPKVGSPLARGSLF
ncbi:uncharacterized protein L3040_005092 [Drepanopeziza brunnea f. sp. 'multigermtubi']|nr:hypothetical protein L3040_005092 [Drepanopeziza brunnea f. sp. 'multigermtubi']